MVYAIVNCPKHNYAQDLRDPHSNDDGGHSRSQSPRFFWSRGQRNEWCVKPSGSGDENATEGARSRTCFQAMRMSQKYKDNIMKKYQ